METKAQNVPQQTRMKFGPYVRQYLKQSLQVFKHPKQLIPSIILSVVWIILGIVQIKVRENLPLKVLNFITYAQGGLYGGVVGAVGGILGKIIVASFVNALLVPLFQGKKPFSRLGNGIKELFGTIDLQGRAALAPLFKGLGAAMMIYTLFNLTESWQNSLVGIVAAVALANAVGRKGGFLWGLFFSYAESVSGGRTPKYENVLRALSGMTLGFALGVGLNAAGIRWAGAIGLLILIIGWIMGAGTRREARATAALILLFLLPQPQLRAQDDENPFLALMPKTLGSERAGLEAEDIKRGWLLKDVETDVVSSSGSSTFFHEVATLDNLEIHGTTEVEFDYSSVDDEKQQSGHITLHLNKVKGPFAPGEQLVMHFTESVPDIVAYHHLLHLWDNVYGEEKEISGQAQATLFFPSPDDVTDDHYEFTFSLSVMGALVKYTYIFEWDDSGALSLQDIADLTWWINGGEGTHAPEEWTVMIAILSGLGGALGGFGGFGGEGGETPSGPEDTPPEPEPEPKPEPEPEPLSPEEEEYRRWKEKTDQLKQQYVRENDDGSRTMTDPATGQRMTLNPKYDENGKQVGWENENETPFSDDDIREWLDDRDRNRDYYLQNYVDSERNVAEQRAINDARNAYDAERGSSAEADEWKAWKDQQAQQQKKEEYMEKLAWKYNVPSGDATAIKKEILKDRQDALEEQAKAVQVENALNDLIMKAEFVQSCSDTLINVGASVVPGGDKVRDIYSVVKNAAARGSEAFAKGGSLADIAESATYGAQEGAIEVWQNHTDNPVGQSLIAGFKAYYSSGLDGKKPEEIASEVKKAVATTALSNIFGSLVDKQGAKYVNKKSDELLKVGAYSSDVGVEMLEKAVYKSQVGTTIVKETLGGKVSEGIYDTGVETVEWAQEKKQELLNRAREYGRLHGDKNKAKS